MFPMTTWVKRLLIANIAMFFVSGAVPMVYRIMVLYPPEVFIHSPPAYSERYPTALELLTHAAELVGARIEQLEESEP